jgi:hypothetical protein
MNAERPQGFAERASEPAGMLADVQPRGVQPEDGELAAERT